MSRASRGLSPAISIDQKSTNRNPRSTVGTVTEIYDYMRLLYARIGIPHCPKCGREIRRQTVDQMVDQIMALPERTKIQLLAPVVRGRKGRHEKVLEQAKRRAAMSVCGWTAAYTSFPRRSRWIKISSTILRLWSIAWWSSRGLRNAFRIRLKRSWVSQWSDADRYGGAG